MDNHKKRILIIEDDGEMRSFLKDFLKDEGYEVDSASNGTDRFCKLVRQSFNLIITDIFYFGEIYKYICFFFGFIKFYVVCVKDYLVLSGNFIRLFLITYYKHYPLGQKRPIT